MGIHGLYQLIKSYAPAGIVQITKEDLELSVAAGDANLDMCKGLYSKENTSTEDIIKRLKRKTMELRKNKTLIVWIFDNPVPPVETEDTRAVRSEIRHKHEQRANEVAATDNSKSSLVICTIPAGA